MASNTYRCAYIYVPEETTSISLSQIFELTNPIIQSTKPFSEYFCTVGMGDIDILVHNYCNANISRLMIYFVVKII